MSGCLTCRELAGFCTCRLRLLALALLLSLVNCAAPAPKPAEDRPVNAWRACTYFCRPFPVRALAMDREGRLGCDCVIPVKRLEPVEPEDSLVWPSWDPSPLFRVIGPPRASRKVRT
jgi:hypothetical protein